MQDERWTPTATGGYWILRMTLIDFQIGGNYRMVQNLSCVRGTWTIESESHNAFSFNQVPMSVWDNDADAFVLVPAERQQAITLEFTFDRGVESYKRGFIQTDRRAHPPTGPGVFRNEVETSRKQYDGPSAPIDKIEHTRTERGTVDAGFNIAVTRSELESRNEHSDYTMLGVGSWRKDRSHILWERATLMMIGTKRTTSRLTQDTTEYPTGDEESLTQSLNQSVETTDGSRIDEGVSSSFVDTRRGINGSYTREVTYHPDGSAKQVNAQGSDANGAVSVLVNWSATGVASPVVDAGVRAKVTSIEAIANGLSASNAGWGWPAELTPGQ